MWNNFIHGKRKEGSTHRHATKMRKEKAYLCLPDFETAKGTLVSVPGMRNHSIWREHRCCAEDND